MNTPAHMIFAAAAFARPTDNALIGGRVQARRNALVLAGGFLPDFSLYFMVAWQRWVTGHEWRTVFTDDYSSALWQGVFAVDNSIPLWGALLALSLLTGRRGLGLFAAAGLLHLAFDLGLHNNDARAHFWPLSGWVFHSPISYWDPAHFGRLIGPVEGALCLILSVILWQRFRGWPARGLIALGMGLEAVPTFLFPLIFAHHG